jgi:hypothetical protein
VIMIRLERPTTFTGIRNEVNEKLRAARALLLPRLMSGAIAA